jgi:hypothetical protein
MTAVDRLGFNLRLKTDDGMKGTRINFPRVDFVSTSRTSATCSVFFFYRAPNLNGLVVGAHLYVPSPSVPARPSACLRNSDRFFVRVLAGFISARRRRVL